MIYPVPWALDPATSFLADADGLSGLLEAAGFELVSWRDTTAEGRQWFEAQRSEAQRRRVAEQGGPPKLGLHILLGPVFPEMGRNMARNLAENRFALVEVICRKV